MESLKRFFEAQKEEIKDLYFVYVLSFLLFVFKFRFSMSWYMCKSLSREKLEKEKKRMKNGKNNIRKFAHYFLAGMTNKGIEKISTPNKLKNRKRTFDDAQIKKIIDELCTKKIKRLGLEVEFHSGGVEDEVDIETGIITINSRHTLEIQYYILLHEIGHYLLERKLDFEEKFKYVQYEKRENRLYKVNWIELELAAWDEGYRYAKRNKYPVDKDYYDFIKSKNVFSYFFWATGKFTAGSIGAKKTPVVKKENIENKTIETESTVKTEETK